MTRAFRRHLETLLAGAARLLCLFGPAVAVHGAEELEEHFTRDWYHVEVVVFQRPGVQDHKTEERLTRPPAPLPASMRSFRLPLEERWSAYSLSPFTRAFLTFPYLDHSLLPDPRQAPALDPDEGGLSAGFEASRPEADAAATETAPEPAAASGAGESPGREPPAIEPRLSPDPLLDFLRDLAEYEAALAADSYRWLPPETFSLTPEARALERRGGYEVLLHGRWLQPVPPRTAPQPLHVHKGPRYGESFALEGTFDVTLGRYLHFRADLFYLEPALGRGPVNLALPPAAALVTGLPPEDGLDEGELTPAGFMQLHESRRLRSGEVHYLDHPKLGVLVRIDPVTPPERLSAAHVALEER